MSIAVQPVHRQPHALRQRLLVQPVHRPHAQQAHRLHAPRRPQLAPRAVRYRNRSVRPHNRAHRGHPLLPAQVVQAVRLPQLARAAVPTAVPVAAAVAPTAVRAVREEALIAAVAVPAAAVRAAVLRAAAAEAEMLRDDNKNKVAKWSPYLFVRCALVRR